MVFLPAVVTSRVAHTSEILASDATKKLFDKLRQSYDYIVVDLSPLAPIVDVRATTHLVDSYIFVIEWGRTKIDVVKHALAAAQGVYENLLGVVLNKVDMNRFGRYIGHDQQVIIIISIIRDMVIRSSGMLAGRSAARNVVLTRIFVAAVGCMAVICGDW